MRRFLPLTLLPLLLAPPQEGLAKKNKKKDPLTAACVGDISQLVATPGSDSGNTFLRTAFDTDPSGYLGRFVSGDAAIDESSGFKTACSEFVSYKVIDGGGVEYDNFYQASSQASANVGIIGAGAGASAGQTATVRVRYTLTTKMVAEINDPGAFHACCKADDDGCSDLYIGEFIGGTGEIMCGLGQAAAFDTDVLASGVAADISASHGALWRSTTRFPNPVYFAFKTTEVPRPSIEPGCGDWMTQAPNSSDGLYFVGLSQMVESEQEARTWAMTHARLLTVDWASQQSGGTELSMSMDTAQGVSSETQISSELKTRIEGITSFVKAENWCIKETATPGGPRYSAHVLAFLPNDSVEAAKAALSAE